MPSNRRFSQSGQKGPNTRGKQRQTRFGAMGVLYDDQGREYPVDDQGQIYIPYQSEQTAVSAGKLTDAGNPSTN